MSNYDFTAACIIPTGIGATIGGFAGDASPYINLLSKICPIITNPNSVNAAVFSGINKNILYTEGYFIDQFFKGKIALKPANFNKIGIIFDKAIPQKVLNVHINTINAHKSTFGTNIINYEITKEHAGVEFSITETGISTGLLSNPKTLINAAEKLIQKGAEAIAVICYFQTPDDDNNYSQSGGVDPVGGVEAIISHVLGKEFNIPVAHAPAFDENELYIDSKIVDKRAAAEYITPTFLPCILSGLYNAPQILPIEQASDKCLTIKQLKALIVPHNCLGSIPVLKAIENNIPVFAVENNKTVLDVTAEKLGYKKEIIKVKNYQEAAGRLLAIKNGIYF